MRIAHQRAAQGQQVVQVVGGVLGHAQRPELGEVEVHLCRRLGAGSHLEFDVDTVDGVDLAGAGDVDRRHDQPDLTQGRGLSQAASHLTLRTTRQDRSVHVRRPAGHRGAGIDVLLHRVFDESFGRQHRDLAGIDVGLGGHPEHAPEVVHVAVGINDGAHRSVTAVQGQRGRRRLGADQRVDDDDTGVAFDEADVGQVQSAHLVDALDHLVKALLGAELRLTPQAGMHRRRGILVEEGVGIVIPDHPAVGGGHHAR